MGLETWRKKVHKLSRRIGSLNHIAYKGWEKGGKNNGRHGWELKGKRSVVLIW